MLKKLLINLTAIALFFGCLFCFGNALGQTVTLGSLSNGLHAGNIAAGQEHRAIFGFSVSVSGGSKIFDQYNLTSSHNTQSFMANGTLYRLTNNNAFNYTTNRGVAVGNVIFNNQTITVSGFSETITNTTYYYFLVIDAINTINGYSVRVINEYGANLAHDVNGVNYPLNDYVARSYDYTLATPYALTVVNQTGDLASPSTTIMPSTAGLKLFKFTVKNNSSSTITISGFNINSSVGSIGSNFNNFKLHANSSDSFPISSTANGSSSASYISFTGLSESISSGATKYYWLVADCPSNASFGDVQFKMTDAQSSSAIITSTPNSSYNNFTAFGNTYNINSAVLAVTSQQNGLAGATVYPAETAKAVFGFGVSATVGSATINEININSNNSSLSTYYGNAKLYRSTTNNYTTGSLTLLGSGNISGAFVNFTGLNESITGTAKYYFLVVDVIYSGGGTNSTAFNFTASQGSSALIQTSPALNFNNFNVSGNTFNITQAVVNVTGNTNGLIANGTALVYGQTARPVFGFEVAVTGSTTVNAFTINANPSNGLPAALSSVFANGKLYKSSTNSYTGTLTQVGTVNFSGNNIVVTGINDSFSNTTRSYFLVVDVIYYGASGNFQPVGSSITTAGTSNLNIYQNYYPFAVPPPSFTLTGNNSVANGITQGVLQYGQTGIVLFGFKLDVMGTVTISEFNIPSTGTSNTFFNTGGTLYRSATPNFSIGTSTVANTAALSWQSGYVSATVNESFSSNLTPTTYYYFLVADYNNVNASSSGTIKYGFSTSQSPVAIRYGGGGSTSPNNVTDGQTFNVGLTYDWVGITSNSFTATGNYRNLNNGGVTTTPGQYDQLRVGVVAYQGSAIQPTINSDASISRLWFGPNNTPTITLGNADELNISDGVVLSNSTTGVITGGNGTSRVNITGGTSTIPSGSTLNLSNDGGLSNAGILNNAGTLTVGDPSTNSGTINVTGTGAVTFSSTLGNTGTINQTSSGTRTFTGVLTNSSTGIIQVSNGTTNITAAFTNSGTFTPTGGTINFAAGFTNSGTFTPSGGTVNFAAAFANSAASTFTATGGTSVFNRSGTQAISNANATTPVTFNNLTVSGSNTKTLSGTGTFAVKSTGIVTMAGTATLAAAGKLTLRSDANSTASVAVIPSGTSITGNVTVERFFTGGSLSNRGWRLMSFPVNTTTTLPVTSAATSNFTSLKTNLLITGTGGSASGWDQPSGYTANGPTILFYNAGTGSFTIPTTFASTTSRAGQGFYFYFRGNRNNALDKVVRSGPNFATPEAGVVGLQTGTLNQQGFTYTLSNAGTGYNLIGNPYPSSISVTSGALTGTTGFVYTFTPGGNSITSNSTPITIGSGQGFFVKSNNVTSSIAFSESMKTASQPLTLLMGVPVTDPGEGNVKLQMVQDSANYDVAQLRFADNYISNYVDTEDADDLNGSGQTVFFGAMTADKRLVGIASQPLDKKKTSVFLSVNDSSSGTFSIKKEDISNIPDKYDVWLMDHFKKDSLNLRADSTYNFNLDKSNPLTFGDARFEVVIRIKDLPKYQLTSFSGKRSQGANLLQWNVQNEYTYTYFELERSFDNKTFEGVNNSMSTATGNYTFTDRGTSNPVVFYRLKQTDIYGNTYTSNIIIRVEDEDDKVFSVYPNPASDFLNFDIKEEVKGNIIMSIYNSVGRMVKTSSHSSNTGQENVSSLLPGPYTVELIDNGTKKRLASTKFIKQ